MYTIVDNFAQRVAMPPAGKEAVIYDLSSHLLEVVDMSAAELLHVLRRGLAPAASPVHRRAIGDLW